MQSSPEWWLVALGVATVCVYLLQLIVFGIQARRLRQTIETMKTIAREQANDMRASIAAATRSAAAIERLCGSMEQSVIQLNQSLEISREISETNKRLANNTAPRENVRPPT